MPGKRDRIFWSASAIFAVSLVLGVTVGNGWLLLMAAAYLLRPTVHSLGFARELIDERQLQIHVRASNVGFAVMVIGNIAVTLYLMRRNDPTWELVNSVLLFGLAARAITGLLLVGDLLLAGERILYGVGLLAALFSAADAGFPYVFLAVLPGLLVAGLGLVSRKHPQAVAALVTVFMIVFCVVMLPPALRQPGGPNWGTVATFGIILPPPLIAAFCLWRGAASAVDAAIVPVAPERSSV
jgi:hypothetical protein